jgi:hypothetical protein
MIRRGAYLIDQFRYRSSRYQASFARDRRFVFGILSLCDADWQLEIHGYNLRVDH